MILEIVSSYCTLNKIKLVLYNNRNTPTTTTILVSYYTIYLILYVAIDHVVLHILHVYYY